MTKLKETAIKAITSLPDEANLDDLLQEIIYHAEIDEGLKDIQERRTVSIEEIEAQFSPKK
ncbi:MAG: hypothetical protein P9X24_17435 [Candidatus Hatepunaea meridiana]|nr:hypothetical protein [Candidatus Hatepunaea meridiana]